MGICPQVFGSFDATPFFPNTSGSQWTYVKNDTIVFTRSVLPISALVNGALTMVMKDSDDGSQQNVTNDEKGICQHRDFRPNTPIEGGIKVNLLLTFNPPPCLARATPSMVKGKLSTMLGVAILAIMGICPQVFGSFDATPFFPNTSGSQWTYVKNDTIVFTRSVLPISALVNGALTMVMKDSDDGSQQNVTNDEKGICQHRDFRPNTPIEGGIKVNLLLTFNPPPCLARANTDIWEVVNRYPYVPV